MPIYHIALLAVEYAASLVLPYSSTVTLNFVVTFDGLPFITIAPSGSGFAVGAGVGGSVGSGVAVGSSVGASVGVSVGASVGSSVAGAGSSVGGSVISGVSVGASVGSSISAFLRVVTITGSPTMIYVASLSEVVFTITISL